MVLRELYAPHYSLFHRGLRALCASSVNNVKRRLRTLERPFCSLLYFILCFIGDLPGFEQE